MNVLNVKEKQREHGTKVVREEERSFSFFSQKCEAGYVLRMFSILQLFSGLKKEC